MRFVKLWVSIIALLSLTAFGLAGCGGGGGGGSTPIITPTVPAAPTGASATGGNLQNTVSWTGVADATSYNIYWSTTPGVTKANGNQILNAASPYLHVGLSSGTTYYYVVTAVNSVGESAESNQASATTQVLSPAPVNVSATPGNGQVIVAWDAVSGASSYNVYYLQDDPNITVTNSAKIAGATSPTTVSSLTNNSTYYFAVTAVVAGVESAPSIVLSAIPATNPAPAAPSRNVRAISSNIGGQSSLSISWDAVPGATSYNAYYSIFPGVTKANGTKVAGVTSTFRPQLAIGTYYFVITAVNANGESTESPEMVLLPPIFTNELVSGKTIKYNDLATGQIFNFVCNPNGTLTFTSNLTGVPASGSGTWTVNQDGTLTVNIPTGSLTFSYEVLSISNNGAFVGVTFTKGNAAATPGTLQIS